MAITPHHLALSLAARPDNPLSLAATPPPEFSALEWAKIFNAARRNDLPPPALHLFQYPGVGPDSCAVISTTPDDQRHFAVIYLSPANGLWYLHPPRKILLYSSATPGVMANPSLASAVATLMATTTLWTTMANNDTPSPDGIRIEPILEVS